MVWLNQKMKFLPLMNAFIGNILKLTEIIYQIHNLSYSSFCHKVYLVPTWSIFAGQVTYVTRLENGSKSHIYIYVVFHTTTWTEVCVPRYFIILCGIHNLKSLKYVRNTLEINAHNIIFKVSLNTLNYTCNLDPFS